MGCRRGSPLLQGCRRTRRRRRQRAAVRKGPVRVHGPRAPHRLFIPPPFIVPRGALQSVFAARRATPLPLYDRSPTPTPSTPPSPSSPSRLHAPANGDQMTKMLRSLVAPSMPCPQRVTCLVWRRRLLGLGGAASLFTLTGSRDPAALRSLVGGGR